MRTKGNLSPYVVGGGIIALLSSFVIVALCSTINLPERTSKTRPAQDNLASGATNQRRVSSGELSNQ